MKIVFFGRSRRRRVNRIAYPKAFEALKPREGYIISNGKVIGTEENELTRTANPE
jgi:hypothetical protein